MNLFSHVLLFYGYADADKKELLQSLHEIINIDEKKSKIYIKDCIFKSNLIELYDIKPYFPSVDRVENSKNNLGEEQFSFKNYINDMILEPIGVIRKISGKAFIETDKLDDMAVEKLSQISHIKVMWWFKNLDKPKYKTIVECNPPYENAPRTGIFATRSPVRPNSIAMTVCRIISIDKYLNRIYINDIDCFDKTPLLDVKSYYSTIDKADEYKLPKWLEHWSNKLDDSELKFDIALNISSDGSNTIQKYLKNSENEKENNKDVDKYFSQNLSDNTKNDNCININGAYENNLKGINVQIPYNKITAITGVSGSGKSSLAYDTIYAECKRRFSDSDNTRELSLNTPEYKEFEGAIPAIAISQKAIGKNSRSTIGTYTSIYRYLKTIYATIGLRHCPNCGNEINILTVDEITDLLKSTQTSKIYDMNDNLVFEYNPQTGCNSDLYSKIKQLLDAGKGVIQLQLDDNNPIVVQTTQMCYRCDTMLFELTPSTFSYNNPESMCPVCNGTGKISEVDVDTIISNPNISILDGASSWWGKVRQFIKSPNANWWKGEIVALANSMNVDLETPWCDLPEDFKRQAIYGSDGKVVSFEYNNKKTGRSGKITRPVEGALNCINRIYKENPNDDTFDRFVKHVTCKYCNGERLNKEGRMVTVLDRRYSEVADMSVTSLMDWCKELVQGLPKHKLDLVEPLVKKIYNTLTRMKELGLGYFTLSREITTLSGGECQRLKLLNQLENKISNVLYIFDEPTAGLHPRDYQKIINTIQDLKANNNTVLLVEHNLDMMKIADQIIDIGVGAGKNGGNLVASGTVKEVMNSDNSLTGQYLSGKKQISVLKHNNRKLASWIDIKHLNSHNLKNIDIRFPQHSITCLCGVSGSGKSTVLVDEIYNTISKYLEDKSLAHSYDTLEGCENISKIVLVEQKSIGRNSRSIPSTYLGLMDEIREIFTNTDKSKDNNYTSSNFSFNSPIGQCDYCHGDGEICSSFIDDIWAKCHICNGKRYKKEILNITYNGKNISEVLDMTFDEAEEYFKDNKKINDIIHIVQEVGLGYLSLGQSTSTISGGEAQRLKLAKELLSKQQKNVLYLFDEPTAGLHYEDINNLLCLINKLVDSGNTVVMIEHNMDVIKNSDWIIELGPDGGENGGSVVAQGTVEDVISKNTNTSQYLK